MKKIISILLSLFMTLSIVVPAYASDEDVSDNTYPTTDEVEEQIEKEQPAIDAYDEINSALGIVDASDPAFPNYPDDFGGAYYENEQLVICLTNIDDEHQKAYLDMVSNPDVIRFEAVEHSYNELYTLSLNLADDILGEETESSSSVSSIGVDIESNEVEIGLPSDAVSTVSLGDEYSDLPISYVEEECSSPSTSVVGGGQLTFGKKYGSSGTLTICGASKGTKKVLTAGHCVTVGNKYKYNGTFLGIGSYRQYKTRAFYDYGIIDVTESGWSMTNKVMKSSSKTTTISKIKSVTYLLADTTVCKYGAVGKYGTGKIKGVNMIANYSSEGIALYGMTKVVFNKDSPNKGKKGDSGSPVYAGHTLYGIYSGDNAKDKKDATFYWFSPISGVDSSKISIKLS